MGVALPRPSTMLEGAGDAWDVISKKGLIPERTLEPTRQCGDMVAQIEALGWVNLCNITTPASPKLVREFYANISVMDGNVVRVRNVSINISPAALNAYLGIPEPENDDYFDITIQP